MRGSATAAGAARTCDRTARGRGPSDAGIADRGAAVLGPRRHRAVARAYDGNAVAMAALRSDAVRGYRLEIGGRAHRIVAQWHVTVTCRCGGVPGGGADGHRV